MSLNSSHISAPPSLTTSPWTLRSIEDWKGSHNTCSPHFMSVDQPQTDSEDQDGSVQCLCYQHTDVRQRDVNHICQTGEKTQFLPPEKHPPYPWHILAKTECPTLRSCPEPTFQAYSPCSDSADCVGWGMSTAQRMAASQKTFSMKSWHLEGDPNAAPSCTTRMSAREAWKHLTSTPSPGRTLQLTTWCGESLWTNTSRQGKRSWWMQKLEKGPTERSTKTPTDQRLHTNATFAVQIISPTLVSTATSDAATIEQTGQPGCTPMIKLDLRRPVNHIIRIHTEIKAEIDPNI